MITHPNPPADLATRRFPITRIKCSWWRIHSIAYDPIFFGTMGNRFDAPKDGSGKHPYGVMYVARDAHGAFVETFGHKTGIRLIERSRLAQRGLAKVTVDRPLRLVDLRAEGLARLGADEALTAGPDYAISQAWSLALHEHPRKPDGVIYRARHDPSRFSAALFERVKPHLRARPVGRSLMDPKNAALLGELLDGYQFGMI